MGESMTPRERVQAALAGETPDRIPRTYAAVPGFDLNHPGALAKIEADYPKDADHCWFELPDGMTQGEPFEIGQYVDEWGLHL
jgi:hypothetical protein